MLFPDPAVDDGDFTQRQVFPDDIEDVQAQQQGPEAQTQRHVVDGYPRPEGIQRERQHRVSRHPFQVIADGIILLSHEPGKKHHGKETGECRPRAGDVPEAGDEKHIPCHNHCQPDEREINASLRPVCQFIPQRQVEKNARKQFR